MNILKFFIVLIIMGLEGILFNLAVVASDDEELINLSQIHRPLFDAHLRKIKHY